MVEKSKKKNEGKVRAKEKKEEQGGKKDTRNTWRQGTTSGEKEEFTEIRI